MENRLGILLEKIGSVVIPERYRLEKAKNTADAKFQQAFREFGGPSGRQVTLEQTKDLLAKELEANRASHAVFDYLHGIEKAETGESKKYTQLKTAQNLKTTEGLQAAILYLKYVRKSLESHIILTRKHSFPESGIAESRRRARACKHASKLLIEELPFGTPLNFLRAAV